MCIAALLLTPLDLLLPTSDAPPVVALPHADKAVHLLLFLWLARTAARSFGAEGWRAACLCALVVTLYGGLLEVLQGWIPGRDGSWGDALFNGLGAVIGALGVWRWPPEPPRPYTPPRP